MSRWRLPLILSISLLFPCSFALADYSQHPRAAELLKQLSQQHGFKREDLDWVEQALKSADKIPSLVQAEQQSAEKVETWTTYAEKRVDPYRIRLGADFIADYRDILAEAELRFGVPPEIIAGVLGIETNFGRFTGKTRVLDALATQGFDHPRRHAFFFSELREFFVFCKETGVDPTTPKGSYAGAMGWAQFMPSNYRRLAVDYDQDGKRNLWEPGDAIMSIARYLVEYDRKRAWRRGEPIMVPARLNKDLPKETVVNKARTTHQFDQLAALGIETPVELPPKTRVGIVQLALDQGTEYWIGLPNFYSVMSYNPRVYYAMTVSLLAREMSQLDASRQAAP